MGYDMYLISDKRNHCRRSTGGMNLTRCLMDEFGMGYWSLHPKYPSECRDLSDDEYDELRELVEARINGEHPLPSREKLRRACEAKLEWLSGHPDGTLAMYKLCSNVGWIVTPEECAAAVAAYDGVSEDDKQRVFNAFADEHNTASELRELFEEWVDFLRRGASSHGFRVSSASEASERAKVDAMTVAQARAECERVITAG